jgi:hypothetical protein
MNYRPWKFALGLCLSIVAFVGSVFAGDSATHTTVGYYMKTQTAPEWTNWIGGIGVGFLVANKELLNLKQTPLFCFPGREPDPQTVLNAWIAKERAKGTVKPGEYFGDRIYLEVAMLIAYEDSFPCMPNRKCQPWCRMRRRSVRSRTVCVASGPSTGASDHTDDSGRRPALESSGSHHR